MSVSITRQAITLAFFKLLGSKPYKKITVSDVTAEAGVNRMTFYYHFKDIDDLVVKKIEEAVLDICKKSALSGDYTSAYLNVYLTVERYKELAKKIFPEFDMHHLVSFLTPLAFQLAEHSLKQKIDNRISSETREIIVHSVGCCMVGSFIEWLSSDMEKDPRELIKGQSKLFDALLFGILRNA